MVGIVRHPLNKDDRTWWRKFIVGEKFYPKYINVDVLWALETANHMNMLHSRKWHCRIGDVHFGRADTHPSL